MAQDSVKNERKAEDAYRIAIRRYQGGDVSGALEALGTSPDPNDPRVLMARARFLSANGRHEEAVHIYDRLVRILHDPQLAFSLCAFPPFPREACELDDHLDRSESQTHLEPESDHASSSSQTRQLTRRPARFMRRGAMVAALGLITCLLGILPLLGALPARGANDTRNTLTSEAHPTTTASTLPPLESFEDLTSSLTPWASSSYRIPQHYTLLSMTAGHNEYIPGASGARRQVDYIPPAPVPLPEGPVASIVDLQPYKTKTNLANSRGDEVILTNLNPHICEWYVLDVKIGGKRVQRHLQLVPWWGTNSAEMGRMTLYSEGLVIIAPGGKVHEFALWPGENAGEGRLPDDPTPRDFAASDFTLADPFTVVCDGLVLARARKGGSKTRMESATDMLRKSRLGDWFVETIKPYLLAGPDFAAEVDLEGIAPAEGEARDLPLDAAVTPDAMNTAVNPEKLGIATDAPDGSMMLGRWRRALNHPAVSVSVMKASAVSDDIFGGYTERVAKLANGEREALVYLTAFDLSACRFGYASGAEHPDVGWSPRAKGSGAGPDGFAATTPLNMIGSVPPYLSDLVCATFVGGFKREHGVFGKGPLDTQSNGGAHFGFMQDGVILSRPNAGIATAAISLDGSMDLFSWPDDDLLVLPGLRAFRQNCAPIIEGIDANGVSIPGELVNRYGDGAWSGNQKGEFLSLRSGLAIQEHKGRRYIIFAFFSGATPNAMARVFQAYNCRYAMLLDMNMTVHCYIALYQRDAEGKVINAEYLHDDMAGSNGYDGSLRFLQTNDTRDFFYVTRQ